MALEPPLPSAFAKKRSGCDNRGAGFTVSLYTTDFQANGGVRCNADT